MTSDTVKVLRRVGTRTAASIIEQVAQVTVPAAVRTGPPFAIDSITPVDSSACAPPGAWAIWSTPTSTAYSGYGHSGQQILITQLVSDGLTGQVSSDTGPARVTVDSSPRAGQGDRAGRPLTRTVTVVTTAA